jgi:short-subunit dehydrogenase
MSGYRTALVTGASSGLGAACAERLAANGCALVLVARSADRLAELAADLRARHGVDVAVLVADLGTAEGLRLVERRLGAGDPVDLLVNSAGVLGPIAPLAIVDSSATEAVVALNVAATVRLTRAAVRAMVPRRRGGVLNLASVNAFWPTPGGAVYSATKAFVISFSQSVHGEVEPHGVHVTVLCPGSVATRLHASGAAGPHASGATGRVGGRLDSARVARAGLAAVAAGRPVCVPGIEYGIRTAIARHAPALARRHYYRRWGTRAAASLAAAVALGGLTDH